MALANPKKEWRTLTQGRKQKEAFICSICPIRKKDFLGSQEMLPYYEARNLSHIIDYLECVIRILRQEQFRQDELNTRELFMMLTQTPDQQRMRALTLYSLLMKNPRPVFIRGVLDEMTPSDPLYEKAKIALRLAQERENGQMLLELSQQ